MTQLHLVANSIDIYLCSPSPFSSSVLLVVDVGDSQQQCYFFDGTWRCETEHGTHAASATACSGDTREEEEEEEPCGLYRGVEGATQFLADLHRSFPQVPLEPSARELLLSAALKNTSVANVEIQSSTQRPDRPGGAKAILKRRRTLSASNFYGSQTHTPLTTPAKSSPGPSEVGSSAWRSFYEKLQFRVSRSQMCQLQGTAEVSSVFPRQQEAFEFADQIASFRQRMRENSSRAGGGSNSGESSDTLFPRVFSFEDAREGKRRFLVSSFASFWDNYAHHTLPTQRHVYEIIREGAPCRLYFDLGTRVSWHDE